ncbi:ENR1 protein, partial [Geococcyx californianus]|nr:ENR1 protein [Geococcyx californianus]
VERENLYECITREPNPFQDEPKISKFWSKTGINNVKCHNYWQAAKGLFWLCGKMGYVMLQKDWAGSCTLGIIRPSFFLLSRIEGQSLGVPL